jgi:hypothetical protein
MMRPASEISFDSTTTPDDLVNARMIGSSE